MHVLVDTSIWVDHFRQKSSRLSLILESDLVFCHPFVIGEIACGWLKFEVPERLNLLPKAPLVHHTEALEFIERHDLVGKGHGFVDVHLLASTFAAKAKLWTRDKRLLRVAHELDTAF